MASRRWESTFDLVPAGWFDSVVGVWTVLLAVLGLELLFAGAERLLRPPEAVAWVGVVVTLLVAAFGYGVFAVGVTVVYRRLRGFAPILGENGFDRRAWWWSGGLAGMAIVVIASSAVVAELVGYRSGVVAPLIAVGTPPMFGGATLGLGLAGVNELLNNAPYVAFVALLGGLVMGPAVGLLFHGIVQDVLARATSPGVAVVATAVATTMVLESSAFSSVTTPHEAVSGVVVFGFVGCVAYAYRETGSLPVVMVGYGVFNVLAVFVGWASVLLSLYVSGHLFG